MSHRGGSGRRSLKLSKRVSKACRRCRDQKIRCTGSHPCDQCNKRHSTCDFDSPSEKILVTRRYLNELHERLATFQHRSDRPPSPTATPDDANGQQSETRNEQHPPSSPAPRQKRGKTPDYDPARRAKDHANMEGKAPLTNPLAFHIMDWVPGPTGKPVFMGTSSTWSFSRRVLGMTHERATGAPLSSDPHNQLFDNHVYNLGWDGRRSTDSTHIFDVSNLPTQDFARYLINAVKFHCGQLLYLFEEDRFMHRFAAFQLNPADYARSSPLWFSHYLLILAFGKSFVVQTARSQSPPGAEHFVQAMQCMPDFNFFEGDPIEMTQVLCCAALYLQCVHRRGPAYRMIGTALRWALEHGMYTGMHGSCLDDAYVQRCSLVWWTVYALERRMSSLLGVPMGISEDSISAQFPAISRHVHGDSVLEMQVMLCQILAKVDLTVYGSEGKLDSRYLTATQSVLRDIAKVTEQLNRSFDLYANGAMSGTSRISAHLHLLEHQCIILTTRPLLYIFLQSKLGHSDPALMDWLKSATVKSLLQFCVDSAQQILRILSNLLEQGLLETFLSFDLDATSTSTMPLIMAAAIDPSLLSDHTPWSRRAYIILDEMSNRGNLSARLVQAELKQLDDELCQLSRGKVSQEVPVGLSQPGQNSEFVDAVDEAALPNDATAYTAHSGLEIGFVDGFAQHYELSPDQLMELANSLDINSLAWPFPDLLGSSI